MPVLWGIAAPAFGGLAMTGNACIKLIVTLGGIGYLPASGTVASAITAGLILAFPDGCFVWALFLGSLVFGLAFAPRAERLFGSKDPHAFVLDEVCGMALSLLFLPITPGTVVISFLTFRFFDVLKPLGVRTIDRWPHPASIVLDDVAAGLYSNIAVRLFLFLLASA